MAELPYNGGLLQQLEARLGRVLVLVQHFDGHRQQRVLPFKFLIQAAPHFCVAARANVLHNLQQSEGGGGGEEKECTSQE